MDANSKIGIEYLKCDPHHTSRNGQMLLDVVKRQNLIIVNTTDKCFGTITRMRETTNGIEKSVIDYFIVCQTFYNLISVMIVDEERKHVLTKYASAKGSKKIVASDHNPLMFNWSKKLKPIRKEVFNLKDPEGLIKFKSLSSNCPSLLEICQNSENLQIDVDRWLKKLNNIMQLSFKKIRITKRMKPNSPKLEELFKIMETTKLRLSQTPNNDVEAKDAIKAVIAKVEKEISLICAEDNSVNLLQHVQCISSEGNSVNRLNMWKIKQKLLPTNSELPTAKKNSDGELVTSSESLKDLYVQTYHRTPRIPQKTVVQTKVIYIKEQ